MSEIGHNSAAFDVADQALAAITDALLPIRPRAKEKMEAYGRVPEIDSEDIAKRVTDMIAQLRAVISRFEQAHSMTKRPYLEATTTIDGFTNAAIDPVRDAVNDLEARLTAYQTAKAKRIQEERLALRKEFEDADDPMPMYERPAAAIKRMKTIRGDQGASAHLQDDVVVEVTDPKKVPLRYLKRPKVLAAIAAEVKPDAKKGDTITGVKVTKISKSVVRRS